MIYFECFLSKIGKIGSKRIKNQVKLAKGGDNADEFTKINDC
jgi:hypothetical protein